MVIFMCFFYMSAQRVSLLQGTLSTSDLCFMSGCELKLLHHCMINLTLPGVKWRVGFSASVDISTWYTCGAKAGC